VEVFVEVFVFVELWAVFGDELGDVGHVGGCCTFYLIWVDLKMW
jgi:hypothetical protein